jgi:hypothetical protein
MERRNLPPFLVVFGVGIVIVASMAFVLSSLAGNASSSAPKATLVLTTRIPMATSVSVLSSPPTAPPTVPSSPLPTLAFQAAPDFTLTRSDGSTFTLSEQLAQGPVVLILMQSGGG